MKPAIKKLRTCTYSKERVPSATIFGQREQHTNKLVCDHPEMKRDWNEKACGPCTVYQNRNAGIVPATAPPVEPGPHPPVVVLLPDSTQQPSTKVTEQPPAPSPATTEQADVKPRKFSKPTERAPVAKTSSAPAGKSAAKTTAPKRAAKAPPDTRAQTASKSVSKKVEAPRKKTDPKITTESKRK